MLKYPVDPIIIGSTVEQAESYTW